LAGFSKCPSILDFSCSKYFYADVEGNIGYQTPGLTPIRKLGHTGKYPVHSNESFDWQGFLPFDLLPSVLNPKEDFIVSGNNKVAPPEYPYTIINEYDWDPPQRPSRVRELILQMNNSMDVNDMVTIQQDLVSRLFTVNLKPVIEKMTGTFQNPQSSQWRETLLAWDGTVLATSTTATVFEFWVQQLFTLAAVETSQTWWEDWNYLTTALLSNSTDPNCHGNCIQFAMNSLDTALQTLTSTYGTIPVWGDVHHATFQSKILGGTALSCFFGRRVNRGGDDYTVNVGHINYYDNFDMETGPTYRQIIDFSDFENSLFMHPMGQSGDVMSGFYDNYLPLWLNGEYIPMKTVGFNVKYTTYIKQQ